MKPEVDTPPAGGSVVAIVYGSGFAADLLRGKRKGERWKELESKGRSHFSETQLVLIADQLLVVVRCDFESNRLPQLAHCREVFRPYLGVGLGSGLAPTGT